LLGVDAGSIVFSGTAQCTQNNKATGNPFGSPSTNGVVIFQSGSKFTCYNGSTPFGNSSSYNVTTFQTGSTYTLFSSTAPSISGRTYANFVYNNASANAFTAASGATFDDLTVTSGTLTLGSASSGSTASSYTIKGNLLVNGGTLNLGQSTGSGSAATNINFSGSGKSVTVSSGTLAISNGASGTYSTNINVTAGNSLTLNNSLNLTAANTTVAFNVAPTAGLTVASGATLTTNGKLTIQSDNTGSGYIGNSAGTISGNVTVQRWLPAQRAYRVLSTPFTAAKDLSAITAGTLVTGLGATNGAYGVTTGSPSVFTYNAIAAAGSALTGVTDATATNWKYTQPVYVLVRGQANEGNGLGSGQSGATYTSGGGPTAFAISATGILNDGTAVADFNLQYGASANNYNLVGNPYASPINLKLLKSNGSNINSNTNIGGTFYVYNPYKASTGAAVFAGGYDAYTNDGTTDVIIPSYGAFFIQAGAAGQTIQFAETAKSTGTALALTGTGSTTPKLTLSISNSYGEMDELKLRIDAGAGNGSTDRFDAAKWSNINFDIYSIASDGSKLSIDARGNDATVIPVGIKTNLTANDFTLKVKAIAGMEDKTVILRDKLLQTETELKAENDSYTFGITADATTKGDNRFELVIQNNKTTAVIDNSNNNTVAVQISPNPVADQLTITLGKDAISQTSVTNVRVLTADGQAIQTQQAGIGVSSIKVGLQSAGKGILLVEVKNDKVTSVQKVLKD